MQNFIIFNKTAIVYMIILVILAAILGLALYLLIGKNILKDIEKNYVLNIFYTVIIIFLWPLVMPFVLLICQSVNTYYIIKNAYNKQKTV